MVAQFTKHADCLLWRIAHRCSDLPPAPLSPSLIPNHRPARSYIQTELLMQNLKDVLESWAESWPTEREVEFADRRDLLEITPDTTLGTPAAFPGVPEQVREGVPVRMNLKVRARHAWSHRPGELITKQWLLGDPCQWVHRNVGLLHGQVVLFRIPRAVERHVESQEEVTLYLQRNPSASGLPRRRDRTVTRSSSAVATNGCSTPVNADTTREMLAAKSFACS